MSEFSMTIHGASVLTCATFDVVNPATGQVYAAAPQCTRDQLEQAFDSALTASANWARDEDVRRAAMIAAAEVCLDAVDEVGSILTAEQGKAIEEAKGEMRRVATTLQYYATMDLPREVIQDDDKGFVEIVRRPLGVVAAITPWNYPLYLAVRKFAPALLAGNTIVLKPSPFTPLATLRLGSLLATALPPGVVNVISGGNELGQWMTAHPVPRKISFTGSINTGKHIVASTAHDLKRVTLELGGNDPAIILDDANVAAIAHDIFWGAFRNNGQICAAIKRVYVPQGLESELVEALVAEAQAVRVGDGSDPATQLGPINNLPQFNRVRGLVSDALAHGAAVASGGAAIPGPGYFFQPTILTALSDGVRLVDEEQFGPALPIIAYDDVDDVVRRANATEYGLSGSVWGTDTDRAAQVAARLDVGTSYVNQHVNVPMGQPFGGAKSSGIGVENGLWGYHEYTQLQVLSRAKS